MLCTKNGTLNFWQLVNQAIFFLFCGGVILHSKLTLVPQVGFFFFLRAYIGVTVCACVLQSWLSWVFMAHLYWKRFIVICINVQTRI